MDQRAGRDGAEVEAEAEAEAEVEGKGEGKGEGAATTRAHGRHDNTMATVLFTRSEVVDIYHSYCTMYMSMRFKHT